MLSPKYSFSPFGGGKILLDDSQCSIPLKGKAYSCTSLQPEFFVLNHSHTRGCQQYSFHKWGNNSAISVSQYKTWFIFFIVFIDIQVIWVFNLCLRSFCYRKIYASTFIVVLSWFWVSRMLY